MGERKHKAVDLEKKTNSEPGPKESPIFTHPIVQLQQTIGNRAVTNMIQCHPQDMMERYNWWVYDLASGAEAWLGTGSGRQQQREAHEQRHAAHEAHQQRHAQEQHEQSHYEKSA